MTGGILDFLKEAVNEDAPVLLVLAGPNGSGKTTFFDVFLSPLGLPFVNADRISETLEPRIEVGEYHGYEAAMLADAERRRLLVERKSFCMETVFSDPAGDKVRFLREAQETGYTVILVYFGLASVELSIARVSQRVAEGGHDVPDGRLRTRFSRTMENLRQAVEFVDYAFLFDNSSSENPFRAVAVYRSGRLQERFPPVAEWAPVTLPQRVRIAHPRKRRRRGESDS